MLLIARWLVKLIPFSDFDYLIPLGYNNQENCKIAGKNFKIKYHVTHCTAFSLLVVVCEVQCEELKSVCTVVFEPCRAWCCNLTLPSVGTLTMH